MLAVVAAAIFAVYLVLDLADISADALDFTTLVTLGLLLLALHLAGFGGGTERRGWSRRRRSR